MFEQDRVRGVLTDERRALIAAEAMTLVDNLSEHEDARPEVEEPDDAPEPAPALNGPMPDWQERPVLCAGGRGNLDDVAAAILAQLLERDGVGARAVSFQAIASGSYASLDLNGVRLVCLSYMNPDSIAHARYAARRLRRRTEAPILVGFWSLDGTGPAAALVDATRADLAATSLTEALGAITALIPHAEPDEDASPRPAASG
jgi:hypothetical protein